jgi:glycosyltransferase involved in cell wall biosynthesis
VLAANRLIWLIHDPSAQHGQPCLFRIPLPHLLEALNDPELAWRVACPLLETITGWNSVPRSAQSKPLILDYLQQTWRGEEREGLLFSPNHLQQQLQYWDQAPPPRTPLLSWFAQLKPPFRQLISPHPLFDCGHYNDQRQGLALSAPMADQHPITDYLIGCTRSHRYRALEPSPLFNPSLWQRFEAIHGSSDKKHNALHNPIPLAHYLAAMSTTSSSCPIANGKLSGTVDGLDESGVLKGWCSPAQSGQPAELEVWLDGVFLGSGLANLPRLDVARRGLAMAHCGFAIELDLDRLSFAQGGQLATARWLITTTDGQYSLGRGDWRLRPEDKCHVVEHLTRRALGQHNMRALADLLQVADQPTATALRHQVLNWCAVSAAAGDWRLVGLDLAAEASHLNPMLQKGVEADSCSRLEILLGALGLLIRSWDAENLHTKESKANLDGGRWENIQNLAAQLLERCYYGPTVLELQFWNQRLRPLVDGVIATLFLQEAPPDLERTRPLVQSLTRLCQEVFGDLDLALKLSQLQASKNSESDLETLQLQQRNQNHFAVALAHFHDRRAGRTSCLSGYEQAVTAVHVSETSLIPLQAALKRLLPLVPEEQARTPRSSSCRQMLDQLAWRIERACSALIDDLINLSLPQSLGLEVRERTISLLTQISEALWCGDGGSSGCTALLPVEGPLQRWLLIGESCLPQCWLYRVEQKRQQLERLGAEVRCLDRHELEDWGMSQAIAWADAVVFCRTPATYGVIRALTFARHCGKRVLADIDDLVFSTAFPPPYDTYGGSISRALHRRLGLDAPLQRWPLEQADGVIVSTQALADSIHNSSSCLAAKPVSVLPNLPLPELNSLAQRPTQHPRQRSQRLVVSTATLAHKQIWVEQLAPALGELLMAHPDLQLLLIGDLAFPSCLEAVAGRIAIHPFCSYRDYINKLAQGTIVLTALETHPVSDCKSAIKWMESSLLGLAMVASPVRAYTDMTQANEHLLLAATQQEWVQQVERLLANPDLQMQLAERARSKALELFHDQVGDDFWTQQITGGHRDAGTDKLEARQKLLVLNVFFAPQSYGGATRVVQEQVLELTQNHSDSTDVTVLCIESDPWQHPKLSSTQVGEAEEEAEDDAALPLDVWDWHGARVVRLTVPAKRSWADIQEPKVERFCRQWLADEGFDLIHGHCCQVLTASPLVAARKLGIPYRISLHDAWWISPELFLVSPGGRLIDPALPFDHIDGTPTAQEKTIALERRSILAGILQGAQQRLAVSAPFRDVYQRAGVEHVDVRENSWTPMPAAAASRGNHQPGDPWRICHVGGMAPHKGYAIFRQAVHQLPHGLALHFTVVDHQLSDNDRPYISEWNGYSVTFIPPVPMAQMEGFYANQDVLVAPSIWPESFGLVTREALSAGLWVITSDIGALAEPIQDGINGNRVKPGLADDLKDAIYRFCQRGRGA